MRAFTALISAAWLYSKNHHAGMVLYFCMFIGANVVLLLEPIVVGSILNTIQNITQLEEPIMKLGFLFFLMICIQVGFWLLHGPARVLENNVAFHTRVAYGDRLFRIVIALPVQWHKDHHSGQTINRIRKSTNALYNFMRDGFQLIEMIMKIVGSVIAVIVLFPAAGIIAVGMCAIAFTVVYLFDCVLLPQYAAINEKEHCIASA